MEYELLKSQILDFSIGNGTDADASFLEKSASFIKENSLNIKDLGYFRLSHFEKIIAEKAYFVSRYKTGTNLYLKNAAGILEALDLEKLLAQKKEYWDLEEVYIGKQNPLAVRLLIEPLADEIKAARIKKLNKHRVNASKQRKNSPLSEQRKLLCGYNLFISNAGADRLSREEMSLFYSLRWQIELLFKIWKSLLSIDKLEQMSIFRFECFLYGRLIALLLGSQIQAFLRDQFFYDPDVGIELSEWKSFAHIKKNADALYGSL